MSNAVTNVCAPLVLPPTPKNVLMCFCDRADDFGFGWLSLPKICEWTCFKRTAVIEAVKWLERSGLIRVDRAAGKSNRVTIDLEKVRALKESGSQTGAPDGPVRQTDLHPSATRTTPVRETDHTSPADGPKTSEHQNIKKTVGQRSAPKHRISENWQPSEDLLAWAMNERPGLDFDTVTANFRDHYIGKGEARASWDASFRTWVRRERRGVLQGTPTRSRHSGFDSVDYTEGMGPNGELL